MEKSPFQVTVRRRGVSPLTLTMVVAADDARQAAGLATTVAELERGGMFEAGRVRRATHRWDAAHDAAAA